ncbi:MAG: hypothetical protein KME32_26130 [Mojavia pulchra JT2-VF2]|jgi:hypothetical protein|uniref:Uncharacterized protein n=1 Tax=Mojavia pulchra JT2-VF2 TaxID=287848 RepID=A0A951Q348_9NOST|nr:hypothetical protein [Mojavia pulchra JT2-VF2]
MTLQKKITTLLQEWAGFAIWGPSHPKRSNCTRLESKRLPKPLLRIGVLAAAKKDKPKVQRPSKKHNVEHPNPPPKPMLEKQSQAVEVQYC